MDGKLFLRELKSKELEIHFTVYTFLLSSESRISINFDDVSIKYGSLRKSNFDMRFNVIGAKNFVLNFFIIEFQKLFLILLQRKYFLIHPIR